jgi:hypothetical protein
MNPEERNARRIVRALRSGCVSAAAARATTVGTDSIEATLNSKIHAFKRLASAHLLLIQGDWGTGKSHLRILCKDVIRQQHLPIIEEQVDGKAASLAHTHRVVSRWLNNIQFDDVRGLVGAVEQNHLSRVDLIKFCNAHDDAFTRGLRIALTGAADGWLIAIGYQYGSPDYPYQHVKALSLITSAADCLHIVGQHGLVLLLDEVENVSREWDIRRRKKCYDTLAHFAKHLRLFTILCVTELFVEQLTKDRDRGRSENWEGWTTEARAFVEYVPRLEVIRPPILREDLARDLLRKIVVLYNAAYPSAQAQLPYGRILKRWTATATRSLRLLIRQAIDYLDTMYSNSAASQSFAKRIGRSVRRSFGI